ncbi:putative ferric-chelate reductase 1 [Exaiptasia diaphana]|uniref:Ferric-chelate reductase 1 n=1 Tax=Exaiptasia diaphana TaxID=2652724 RepID=A0A913WVH5_EXADI|nr:putative ferric-chelate reductase 1 [Exaiptasia diaphana]KXJ17564.1 putative ferric-chelate reductase 1 [Exaiptasia diaphana]
MYLLLSSILIGFALLVFPRCSLSTSPKNLPIHIEKSGCPKTKGCFSFPEDCKSSKDCDYLVTYLPGKENVTFSVSAKGEYVALGFNDKPEMGGTDTVICFKARIGYAIAHFSLVGHDSPQYDPADRASLAPQGMKGLDVSYEDGVIKCRFERQKDPTKYMKYDLNKNLYLIFARGKSSGEFIKEHSWKDTSWKKVNVSTLLEIEGKEFDLLLAHAGLMFLAWIGFATVGIFTSRYRKSSWGDKKLLNSDLWFRIHQVCMLSTIVLSLIGIIVIFVHVGSFAEGAHPIIGIFILAFMIAQPIMAFFRPDPQAYSRFLFNWIHRLVGFFAVVFAILNCYLGINMVDGLKVKGNATLSVFVVIMVLVIVLYEVFLFRNAKPVLSPFSVDSDGQDNVQINTPADQVVHDEPTTPQTTTEKRDSILRDVVFYFVLTLCLSCCLGFFIVLGTVV